MAAVVYGLTDAGFITKPLTAIRDDLNTAFRDKFGISLTLNDRSVFGVIVGILSERFAIGWQQLEVITTSLDPSKASGTLLDGLSTLTGTFRPAAAPSTVTLTLTGVDGTTVPIGSLAQTLSTLKNFKTLTDALITAVPAWAPTTAYVLGARVFKGANVYQNIQAGTSAGSGGPTGTGASVDTTPDGTCLWTFVGTGAAAADVKAESEDDGAIIGATKDIAFIVNPLLGWQSVTNLADADPGRVVGSDSELRQLRENELAAAGSSPFDALLANLQQIPGVSSVTLFVNSGGITDVNGVPPHSVEALVEGGDDQDIYDVILQSIAAGIGTFGNHTGASNDITGTAQIISFSRPTSQPIYVALTLSFDSTVYPGDGDSQVRNGLVAYVAGLSTGRDVTRSALSAQPFKVAGVIDVSQALLFTDVIATATAWTSTTGYVATVGTRSVVTNDGGRTYICITSGTSAGSGGPTGTGTDITDGSVHWRFLGSTVVITPLQRASLAPQNVSVVSTVGTL